MFDIMVLGTPLACQPVWVCLCVLFDLDCGLNRTDIIELNAVRENLGQGVCLCVYVCAKDRS